MANRIVHICGPMGSGKTTLIKKFMVEWGGWKPVDGGRRLPVGYRSQECGQLLLVAGAYRKDLGSSGCDTYHNTLYWYEFVEEWWRKGYNVIYEGAFMRNHTRGVGLWNRTKALTVVHLTTSADDCRRGIISRRQAKGNFKDTLNPNLDGAYELGGRDRNYAAKMKAAGAPIVPISREDGLEKLCVVLFDV